jgi:1-acyl-sn-glycerol-3-phosphate acyltransferase
MQWWWKALQQIGRLLAISLYNIRVYGRKNIPKSGGLLLASNHASYLDPIVIAIAIDREINFVARSSLFKNPLFSGLITLLNAFPIERDSPDLRAIREIIDRLSRDCAIVLFPEGTRTKNGMIGRMKAGVQTIARKSGVPIVPVLIEGTYKIWSRWDSLPKIIGKIKVYFGKPLSISSVEACKNLQELICDLSYQGVNK